MLREQIGAPAAEPARSTSSGRSDVPLLEARSVCKQFGAVPALTEVSLAVYAGRSHALAGRNGAGKSTLVSLLTGLSAPDSGRVLVDGQPSADVADRAWWRRHVACVYQRSTSLPHLTVAENLFLNAMPTSRSGRLSWTQIRSNARQLLEQWQIDVDPDTDVAQLKVEQRKLVEIARALALGTRVILLDEPTAELDGREINRLFGHVRRLQASGVTFLYISHHLEEIYEICQEVTVLRDGRRVVTAPVTELDQRALVAAMVGDATGAAPSSAEVSAASPTPARTRHGRSQQHTTQAGSALPAAPQHPNPLVDGPQPGEADLKSTATGHQAVLPRQSVPTYRPATNDARPLLDADSVTVPGWCRDVSFTVAAGERVGLAGLSGSGKSQVADVLAGLLVPAAGRVSVHGQPLRFGRVDDAQRLGISYVPEDRRARGFCPNLTLAENLTLTIPRRLGKLGLVSPQAQTRAATELAHRFGVKTSGVRQFVTELSGGNQQKAVIGRAMASDPQMLVLVHPTAGVDVASKEAIYEIIRSTRGLAALVVSDEIDDLAICGRVLIMFRGSLVREMRAGWQREELVAAMEGVAP